MQGNQNSQKVKYQYQPVFSRNSEGSILDISDYRSETLTHSAKEIGCVIGIILIKKSVAFVY
jgi:hypothetical protein